MALRAAKFIQSSPRLMSVVSRSAHHGDHGHELVLKEGEIALISQVIGKREVVGYGRNGQFIYHDDIMYPYSAITYKEITPAARTLLDKQKGDWKSLSKEDIKAIYRINFGQTFAEMTAPSGRWKMSLAQLIGGLSFALFIWFINKTFIYGQLTLPESFSQESKYHRMWREIDTMANPITGIASKWDYENNRWKD